MKLEFSLQTLMAAFAKPLLCAGRVISTNLILNKMEKFRYKGFTYELIIRPWKKGNAKYEAIKWKNGFRNLWDRISYDEFLKVKSEAGK